MITVLDVSAIGVKWNLVGRKMRTRIWKRWMVKMMRKKKELEKVVGTVWMMILVSHTLTSLRDICVRRRIVLALLLRYRQRVMMFRGFLNVMFVEVLRRMKLSETLKTEGRLAKS